MGWLRHALILMTIAAAAVTLAVASHHTDWSVSLSGSGRHELTDASAALAGQLQAPVRVVVALPPDAAARDAVRRLARRYRDIHEAFDLRFVDPSDPAPEVRRLGLRPGEALVFLGEHAERVHAPTEARISAALERLLRRGERYIVWLTGHGGRDLKGEANHDLGLFGRALERKGYRLQPLTLERTPVIPDNTALLIVATPTIDFSAAEQALLRDFVERGGAVLWLADGEAVTGLTDMLPITPRPQLVLDPASEQLLGIEDPRLLLLDADGDHPITAALEDPLLMAGAHALTPRDGSDWTLRRLLSGSDRHYLAPGPSATLETSAGNDSPAYLAITLERQGPEGPQRAAVLGDGDLLANSYLGNGGNLAFGLSLVDWLVQAEDFVGRYLTGAPDQKLRLSATSAAALAFGLLLVVPGLFVAGAFMAWRRQRHG
jgi:hypothetical protein